MSRCRRCPKPATEWREATVTVTEDAYWGYSVQSAEDVPFCPRHAEEFDEETGFHSAAEILEEIVPELYQEAMQAKGESHGNESAERD